MQIHLEEKDVELIVSKVLEGIKPLLVSQSAGGDREDVVFDVDELAAYLKVAKTWVYERTHLNEIPYYKLGRFPRFRKSEIDKWLLSKKRIPVDSFSSLRTRKVFSK